MNSDTISQLQLGDIAIGKSLLWGVFGFALLICIVISSILAYHWHAYGMKNPKILFAQTIYFTGVLFLIVSSIYYIISF